MTNWTKKQREKRWLAFRLACRQLPIDASAEAIMAVADQRMARMTLDQLRAAVPPDD